MRMNLDNKHVVVTGGAGLIGSTIVDQLLRDHSPRKITVIDNLTRGTMHNLESALSSGRVDFVDEDIRNTEAISQLFAGFCYQIKQSVNLLFVFHWVTSSGSELRSVRSAVK